MTSLASHRAPPLPAGVQRGLVSPQDTPPDAPLARGLARGHLHELVPAIPFDRGAQTGLGAALLALAAADRPDATLLWLFTDDPAFRIGSPYGAGLADLGLDPRRLLFCRCRDNKQLLWALEEGLRCRGVAAVIGETRGIDGTASRRLSLLAREVNGLAIALSAPGSLAAATATSRWQVSAAPDFAWNLRLLRSRDGRTGNWTMRWDHAAYRLRMAEPPADRPVSQPGGIGRLAA